MLYIAKKGDTMAKIARKYNIADPDTIYDHAPNQGLRDLRSEKDLLAPGDEVWVPVQDELEVPTKGKNNGPVDITVNSPEAERLVVVLKNEEGEPYADREYVLKYPDQEEEITGTTDGEGKIDEEVPSGIEEATVEIEGKTIKLYLGYLDPPDVLSGYANRLRNLAYFGEAIPRSLTPKLQDAISKFQEDNELTVSGTVDQETADKLVEKYGC